jgi:hypothetical protein
LARIKQLILDMPVRWSSTYGMLHRADQLKEVSTHTPLFCIIDNYLFQSVDTFVSHMARDEPDRSKRAKLDALQLSKDEWDRVKLFLDLLVVIVGHLSHMLLYLHLIQHADRAQLVLPQL